MVENPNASARGAALLGGQATGIIGEVNEEPVITREIEPDPQSHAHLSRRIRTLGTGGGGPVWLARLDLGDNR